MMKPYLILLFIVQVSDIWSQNYDQFVGTWSETYLVVEKSRIDFDTIQLETEWTYVFKMDTSYIQNERLICDGESYFPQGKIQIEKKYMELIPLDSLCRNNGNGIGNWWKNIKWVTNDIWYSKEKSEIKGQYVYNIYKRVEPVNL